MFYYINILSLLDDLHTRKYFLFSFRPKLLIGFKSFLKKHYNRHNVSRYVTCETICILNVFLN
jgi:hypothetical protein